MKLFYPFIFCLVSPFLYALPATEPDYITIHHSKTHYKINALDDVEESVWKNYTIHHEKGLKEATLILPYDKQSKITEAEIMVKNKFGMITKYKLRDFTDQVMQDGYSIFSDNRLKYLKIEASGFPMNIDFRYTIKYNNTLGLGRWMPQEGYHYRLEHAELTVQSEIPDLVSYKEVNFRGARQVESKSLAWVTDTLEAIQDEDFDTPMEEKFSMVLLATNQIEFEGHRGDLGDWNQYGKWVNGLIRDRDQLPPEDQLKINALVKATDSPKSKINTLYKYLQENTRYVSIQLGIGGFQPMAASEVAKAGYGDCKALSNYMRALLKHVGINSYYTEIGSGSRKINHTDFSSLYQTNHVILTVPGPEDTLFLECTNQYFPPGYLGNANSDRYALMACPEGGRLIRTPVYDESSNTLTSHSELRLDAFGHGASFTTARYGGLFYETYADYDLKGEKEKKEQLLENRKGMDYALDSFSYYFDYASVPRIAFNEYAHIKKYASVSGIRMFIPLQLIHELAPDLIPGKSRINDIVIPFGFSQKDTLSIVIPSAYEIESLPKPFTIKSAFGELDFNATVMDRTVQIRLHFTLLKTRRSKEAYTEFSDLLSKASRVRQSKIVIKKIEKP